LDYRSVSIILLGSTFGLILRIFIQNNFKKRIGFDIQNTSIVNFLSSFFLGILVALDFINNEILYSSTRKFNLDKETFSIVFEG